MFVQEWRIYAGDFREGGPIYLLDKRLLVWSCKCEKKIPTLFAQQIHSKFTGFSTGNSL